MKKIITFCWLSVCVLTTNAQDAQIKHVAQHLETGSSVASIEVVSHNENQEVEFEATLIAYFADRAHGFESFNRMKYTTPQTFPVHSSDFVAVFKKIEGTANLRVTLAIKDGEQAHPLSVGGESCIVVVEDKKGYATRL